MSENKGPECGISFSRAVRTLANNIDGLRDFVTTVEAHLMERQKTIVQKNADQLTPFFLAIRKLNPEGFPASTMSDDEMAKHFKGRISIKVKKETEGKKAAQIKITGEGEKDFTRAMKELGKNNQSINLLYSNALISLLNSVELFLSQLMHLYYRQFPDAVTTKDKLFSIEDLKGFDSIESARSYVIESRVENVLRGSFEDWINFFKTQPKLSMGYLASAETQMTETCQRRNLIVHNGGIVNSIYLSKVSPEIAKQHKKGEMLLISPEYLKERLNLFELNGLLIALEMWKRLAASDEKRGITVVDLTFTHLCAKRWSLCEGLAYFLMNDKEIPEQFILLGRLNYWLSVKRQNRWEDVKAAANSEDMSAKSQRYQLGWLALCEKNDDFFKLLPMVIRSKEISREELRDFPIFEEMRRDSRSKKFLPKLQIMKQ